VWKVTVSLSHRMFDVGLMMDGLLQDGSERRKIRNNSISKYYEKE
jgi:hypothetical protein